MFNFTSSLVWESKHAPQVRNCAKISRPFPFLRPSFHTIWTKALIYNEQRVCCMWCVSVNQKKLFPAPLYRLRPDIKCRVLYSTYMDKDTRQIWVKLSAAPPPAVARNDLTMRAVRCGLPDKIMSLHVKHETGPSVNGYPRHSVYWVICLWGKTILVV